MKTSATLPSYFDEMKSFKAQFPLKHCSMFILQFANSFLSLVNLKLVTETECGIKSKWIGESKNGIFFLLVLKT